MNTRSFRRHALASAVVLALAGTAQAQLSTATIKGQISGAATAQGLAVTAVNQANGTTYRTATLADGSYVLTGLAPGSYEIRVAGPGGTSRTESITVAVGETAALNLALASGTQQITIVGNAQRKGVRSSEVGTNVSRRLIETLPQGTRNFLSSADLAPGVTYTQDGNGYTKLQSGAQNFDHINVFVDGVGQKNNILRGGLTGQDSSRGNPFPQGAVSEYRVLTQNYKAELEQVSSAAITAITKSGTNEFQGEAYIDRTGTSWREKSVFEKEREAAGVALPKSTKTEYGFSLGGPVVKDQMHFFFAYDGKEIGDSRQFVPRNIDKLPAGQGLVPSIIGAQGSQVDKFTEHLLFGKLDAQLNEDQRIALSMSVRREEDRVPENRDLSMPGNDKNRKNDETRLTLKHEWNIGKLLSEARIGYEDHTWNPQSAANGPLFKYRVGLTPAQIRSNSGDVAFGGGSPDAQKRGQKGTFISEDLTWTGLKGHVIKGGVKFKAMSYDLSGTARSVDVVETLLDTTTGLPYYANGRCTGANLSTDGLQSDQCRIDLAIAPVRTDYKNNQFGIYIQDDWAITPQIELNLGVRWDYESNMLNNDQATPADRVAALKAEDGRTIAGITAPAGQTYAQSLAKGGINIDDYISTGSSRKAFKGALAPRLGASYDVFGDRATVVFGGWGRSYSRTMANHAMDEKQKNLQPGGEIWLIRNEFKMPYADQLSLGVRQAVGVWNAEVTLSRVDAKNQFIWFGGNRDPNGGFGTQSPIDPLWGGPRGYGTLILGDFVGETKTTSLFLSMAKPYTRASGWSANVSYTYSDAKTTSKEWNNDIFDWTYGRAGARGWNPSTLVAKNRIVAAAMTDTLLPWGMTLAGKLTWDDGLPRRITSCAAGWDKCISVKGDAPSFMQVDLSLGKEFKIGSQALTLRADVLNLFDKTNYGGFDDWGGGPGNPQNAVGGDNANLGKPNSIRGDTRTLRLMLGYKF